jgi:hypothetical protein
MMKEPKTIEDALAHNEQIGGSRVIEYGGMMTLVPVRDIQHAMTVLQANDRRKVMASVNATLALTFPKVRSGAASQKMAMNCAQDIAIWFANEVLEGRASLEVH